VSHPSALPPAFTPTTIPAVAQVNGIYVVLQGVIPGSGAARVLMGGFGYLELQRDGVTHEGLDLNSMGGGNADLGALVVAPVAGVVTFVGYWDQRSTGFGNHLAVWLDDPRASQACYLHPAHLDTIVVAPGQRVAAGQVLGTCGRSGNQLYSHVHLALWHAVPPGGWAFWQRGWSRERVAAATLDPQQWFWASVTKAGALANAGGGQPPPQEALEMLSDWEMLYWVMPELWGWQTIPYNPEALTSKAWLQELRQGRYRGRPRTGDRPYGEGDEAGHWAEFEEGLCTTRTASGEWSWQG
jgi:murein DD-endopeptidase MepM/ murein hydrolase activator NlpD